MKNITLYIDIAFCIVVLPIMIMIFPVERWFHNFQWYVVSVGIWLYCLYFLNRFITVPYMFRGKKEKAISGMLIAGSIIITFGLTCITLYTSKPNVHDAGILRIFPKIQQYQQAVWSLFMIVEAFSFAVGLLTQAHIQRCRRQAVEAERDRAEIELYKNQIKPHFLFNTLNSLYGLFLTKNENALSSLEKFISMMKYIHTTTMCDLVPLSDEIDYIKQYVGLQSLRLNEMTDVKFEINVEDGSLMVPPILLVTFVENCFKHGISPIEKSCIKISLSERGGKMEFTTWNRILHVKHADEHTHTGIENCRRRLELLYPGKHELTTSDSGAIFTVKLIIDLA